MGEQAFYCRSLEETYRKPCVLQADICQESDPFPGRSQQAVCCADTLGITATLLGALDPVVQITGNSPSNCSGINQLDLFVCLWTTICVVSLAQRRNFIDIRIHMQYGKSTFFSCFYSRGSNANVFPELHIDHGISQCPCAGGKGKQKIIWEPGNCWQEARRHTGCSFMGDANFHQLLIHATQQVFFLTLSPFFPIYCKLPSSKVPFLFLSLPLSLLWVAYPLPMCRWVAKDCCCFPLCLQGGILCPASGEWSRWGAQALWLPQEGFHSSWGGGMTGKQLFYRPQMPIELLCVYRRAWITVLESWFSSSAPSPLTFCPPRLGDTGLGFPSVKKKKKEKEERLFWLLRHAV